jgi:hypothetical protein
VKQLALSCLASLALYAGLFGFVLDRPLSHGFLAAQIEQKLARGAAIPGRKLVILAGSNGPYSHRCETIEPILGLPCINGGVAVGIGLDYLFIRWAEVLHPGDVVYMPMEQSQYLRSHAASALGPDAAILFRHDWGTLAKLPPRRWVAALFAFDLRAGVMSVIEAALVAFRFHDPRAAVTGASNAWGDHVGHSAALAAASREILAAAHPRPASAAEIAAGDGTAEIAGFVTRMSARGVTILGGLPTGFDDLPLPENTLTAIRAVYADHGGAFLMLENRSRYPRADFFDTPEHLNEAAQIVHSRAIAVALANFLGRPAPLQALAAAPR